MAKLKIDVHDLHKYYGENEVLKGISAKFYEGDVVCIIGPSGSGKSTFLRSLNLLEEVTKGQITVNGYDLTDSKTNVDLVRENIGMVFPTIPSRLFELPRESSVCALLVQT